MSLSAFTPEVALACQFQAVRLWFLFISQRDPPQRVWHSLSNSVLAALAFWVNCTRRVRPPCGLPFLYIPIDPSPSKKPAG